MSVAEYHYRPERRAMKITIDLPNELVTAMKLRIQEKRHSQGVSGYAQVIIPVLRKELLPELERLGFVKKG